MNPGSLSRTSLAGSRRTRLGHPGISEFISWRYINFFINDTPEDGQTPPELQNCSVLCPVTSQASNILPTAVPFRASRGLGVRKVALSLQKEPFRCRSRETELHWREQLSILDLSASPQASAPAYRRFQVTGDAWPPGLVIITTPPRYIKFTHPQIYRVIFLFI